MRRKFIHYTYFRRVPYPMHFACFACRKSFKQLWTRSEGHVREPRCPDCGLKMWEMGRQFKAPKRSNLKQWRKVEALVRSGITFHRQRVSDLMPFPAVLREVASFVRRVRDKSDGERLLERMVERKYRRQD